MLTMTDPLGRTTSYEYDELGRVVLVSLPDADGDPLTTGDTPVMSYAYGDLNRLIGETILVSAVAISRVYAYDVMGNVNLMTDRNGRVTEFEYDNLYRRTGETWLDESSVVVSQFEFGYDLAGQLLSAGDGNTNYVYAYDGLGRMVESAHDYSGFAPSVVFAYGYDLMGSHTSTAATVGANADFVNTYAFDDLYRTTRVTQSGQNGGNAVAEKRVDLDFDISGQRESVSRYADLGKPRCGQTLSLLLVFPQAFIG